MTVSATVVAVAAAVAVLLIILVIILMNRLHVQQLATVKAELRSETEQILKAREEALDRQAEKTFAGITEDLGRELHDMKEAFEKNGRMQAASSAGMKADLENAVRSIESQTRAIGEKADHLAEAMRGQSKYQGIWGETLLENMLRSEQMVRGRDYDREDVIRDGAGLVVHTDEGRSMRPDFVLHYPDGTDVLVDSKVSLNALCDYLETDDELLRADAARRNLEAVKAQVDRLSRKDYARYAVRSGARTLDYVLMFVPNSGALQLARELEPDIWRDAFSRNVLIVTEETVMPFLRMIRSAWVSAEQVRNQKQMVEAAQRMLDRVADFSKAHAEMGRRLEQARECYEACDAKLRDSGKSIAVAARQVIRLGVPANPSKPLPEPLNGGDDANLLEN